MKHKDHFTSGDVAQLLGIPSRTVRRYLTSGKIAAVQNPITGTWSISRDALVAFMVQHDLDTGILVNDCKVLIVDDDESVLHFVSRALQRSKWSMDVESVSSGYDALIKLGMKLPDIVILDLHMPGTDGRQVIEAIRGNEETRNIKIMVISGYPDEMRLLPNGSVDYVLGKPFGINELYSAFSKLLSRGLNEGADSGIEMSTT